MNLQLESYQAQTKRWPTAGRHILAQFDQETVVVYQAYSPGIGQFAAENGYFGGAFSYSRMSWIKPNFLWMMYRCGWGRKQGQEVVLAVHLKRAGFDRILAQAVHSTFIPEFHEDEAAWKKAVKSSEVRLQWDPDHGPHGERKERRAIQLGLSGSVLRSYGREWIVSIEDVSAFVREQHANVAAGRLERLLTPREDVYRVSDRAVAERLGLDREAAP